MSVLTIDAVSKEYPGHRVSEAAVLALRDVCFEVAHGEFCSIVGLSGCGKTTLLGLIAGFERPSSGRILVDGKEIRVPGWQRAVVFQDYALFPWMTVTENISFGLEMKKIDRAKRREIIAAQLNLVGLTGFEHRYPNQLSGGMKQRVSIARALAVNPGVLLMDEPFAALDAQNRAIMQRELARIWEHERKTVVFITHSIEEAIALSDRIIVLSRRPGTVRANVTVGLKRPRLDNEHDVISLKHAIHELIHEEHEAL